MKWGKVEEARSGTVKAYGVEEVEKNENIKRKTENAYNIKDLKKESKKIKILFGITLSEIGGAQRVLYDIISSLSEDRYDITLVTSGNGELVHLISELNSDREEPVKIIILDFLKREISPRDDLKTFYELFNIIRKGKFDIAHFHSSKMGIIGRLAAWLCGTRKIFFTVHGWGISDEMSKTLKKALGLLEQFCGRVCTKVICVSKYDRDRGIKNKYISSNKSCVIHNGIENRRIAFGKLRREFQIPNDIPIVGMVSRLMEPKLPQLMINVAKELYSRGRKIIFFIIGDGPQYDECRELIDKYGLKSRVLLLGERKNARELMSDFDVLTLFSNSEGLPITILEGMLCGIPVVASKVGGIPELVENGVNGYLVDNKDAKKAADFIDMLLYTREGRNMGQSGRKKVLSYFLKERMIWEYENLYLGAVNINNDPEVKDKPQTIAAIPDSENQPLSKNFSWVLLGNTSYAVSKGLLLMLIAKLGNVEMVGQFALALAITNPVFMLSNLRLRLVLGTDNERKYSFNDYIYLRVVTSIIGVFICGLIILLYRSSLEQTLVVLIMAAAKVFESFSDIIFGKFENKERMDIVGKSMLFKAIVTTSMMGIPFYLTGNLIAGTAGLAAAFFILFVFYDYRKARAFIKSDKSIEHRKLWDIVKVSFPLGMLQALVSLNGNIPLFFIKGYLGTTALGYYSSIAYLAVIGETVNIAIGQSVTPRLSKYYSQMDKSMYIKILIRTVAASTVLGVLGLVVTASSGGFILSIFYTHDYAEYWGIFMLQMVAACSNYIGGALSNSITAARKFKIQPLLYCSAMVFNAIFMMILVPSKGLEGASYAVIISSYISLVGNLLTNIFLIWK